MTAPASTTVFHALSVDPKVKEMERRLRVRSRSHSQMVMLGMIWTTIPVFALLLVWVIASKSHGNLQESIIAGVLGAAVLAAAGLCGFFLVRKTGTPYVNAMNDGRRGDQRSIERSREIAITLGEDVVPVLTKEHVEAGIRFDNAVNEHGIIWTREDMHGIRRLLIEDISRESALTSLVTERGMTTLSAVSEALQDIESNPKPLQNGWL